MTELVRTYKLTDSGAWGWVTEEAEGGGGGSLPSWWTVDSTPGSESVEFAGAVTISPSASNVTSLRIEGVNDGNATYLSVGFNGQGLQVAAYDINRDLVKIGAPDGSVVEIAAGAGALLSFFGGALVAQQALDPATCTAEDVANALIASTLMAQA